MSLHQFIGCSAAAIIGAGALFATATGVQATMLPASHYATSYVQHVDCALGAHIGPLGACIIGTDDNPPVVVEHRTADAPQGGDGCSTKSVTRTDGAGNTETRTNSNC